MENETFCHGMEVRSTNSEPGVHFTDIFLEQTLSSRIFYPRLNGTQYLALQIVTNDLYMVTCISYQKSTQEPPSTPREEREVETFTN